jgi:outer membrane protein TolC
MSKFLEKFRSDSLQEVLNLDVSNLKYKPQFNLYGNAGLKAIEFQGIQRKFGAAVGLALSIPIYDGHQKEYTRQQSEINLQNIDNYKQNFLIQKNNRQNALVSALDFLEKKMAVIHSQLTDYEKLIELYQTELKAGTLEIINYMNTIRLYTTLENELSMNETNKFLIINESNYYNW